MGWAMAATRNNTSSSKTGILFNRGLLVGLKIQK